MCCKIPDVSVPLATFFNEGYLTVMYQKVWNFANLLARVNELKSHSHITAPSSTI